MDNEETSSAAPEISADSTEPIVTFKELEALIETKQIGDVVQVSDMGFQKMILLDDLDGKKRWNKFSGKDRDFMLKSNEWFKQGQKLFKDAAMTPEETEQFREALLAIGVLGNFFDWNSETVGDLIDQSVVIQAHRIYCRTKNITVTIDELQDNQEFIGYLNLVAIMAKTFTDLVKEVRASAQQAAEDNSSVADKAVLN